MRLFPTRLNDREATFSQAVLEPMSARGGLYAPKELPVFSREEQRDMSALSYAHLAKRVIKKLEIDIDDAVIELALESYALFDDPNDPAPLKEIGNDLFVCELWHGPTRSFKDMALCPFGRLLGEIAAKRDERLLILTATSGDTGPAALKSFSGADNIDVVCLYPHGKTSRVQELQMISQKAPNLKVIAIEGDFDDAQNALKKLLSSERFKGALKRRKIRVSAANSINFGRILFQIIYHVRSALALGEPIDIIIPSGNFGNALGAFYARKMGFPIGTIVVSSNSNNVLTDLIMSGRYDLRERHLVKTTSPAMDILKSSNVERVIFDLFGCERANEIFTSLENERFFALSEEELSVMQGIFEAAWSSEEMVDKALFESAKNGYIIDPHTATCIRSAWLGNSKKKVICSTAEWTKFAPTLQRALNLGAGGDEDALKRISAEFNAPVNGSITALFEREYANVPPIRAEEIEEKIVDFIALRDR
ncbi:MAG: threonine synthase [Helicobacteraceae bacterium]|jgi:threonine synthase|nr:threonine synthase [Helicobacteraceae bacterium]